MAPLSRIPQPFSDGIDIYLLRVFAPRKSSWPDLVGLHSDVLSIGMHPRRSGPKSRDDSDLDI
jgi:hypothetical protein